MSFRNSRVLVCVLLWACAPVLAQYEADYEGLNGSPDGVQLNDQDGYYNPIPDTSVSCLVYTYDGNGLGLPQNVGGDEQFVGCTGPAGGSFARSQKDVPYGDGTGAWTASMDVAITFTGNPPTTQNAGSFSTQAFPEAATMILLAAWTDINNPVNWDANAVWFNAGGGQLTESLPPGGFQGLVIDHWYRWSLTFDLDTNRVLTISITDLDTNETTTYAPTDRYLSGGAGGGSPPTGFRFFGGSSTVVGNTTCWDNLEIRPSSGACCLPNGSCADDVPGAECAAQEGRFAADTLCEDLDPPCVARTGACCIEGGGCTRDPEWCCDCDVDGDCQVNPVDDGLVQAHFGSEDEQDLCNYDIDCDGQINPVDSGLVQSKFGTCNDPRAECGGGGGARCEVITAQACEDAGGDFLGLETDCADDPCGFALGACCVELDCVGTIRRAACQDVDGGWFDGEDCDVFECPERGRCGWDNSMIPDGFSGRAISPPNFPDIRVVDDIVTDTGCTIENVHANIIEDGGWTDDGMITVTVYANTGNGPGAIVEEVTTAFTKMDTGDDYFGRDDYDYWIEGLSIDLDPGTYWIGLRNQGGGGSGTNYWMTSDGGFDGPGSDTGWFSLNGGSSWMAEGAGWHHAFEILP